MRTKLEWALFHAAAGFWVFPIVQNGKTPRHAGWQKQATRNPAEIKRLWAGNNSNCNIGAYTSRFNDDLAMVVVDVDNKNGKNGDDTIFDLDMDGYPLPLTYQNITASGGRHLVYWADKAVKQGAQVIGAGLDIRSRGGYIVMAGSTIGDKSYVMKSGDVTKCPDWLYSKLLLATNVAVKYKVDTSKIDPQRARERAVKYLDDVDMPDEGQRNEVLYKVACEIRDRGCDEIVTLELLSEWNDTWESPLDEDELENTIHSAYSSAQNPMGAKAPESCFEIIEKPEVKDPILAMNDTFALAVAGGGHHILWETTDVKGNFKLEHLNEASFHKIHAHKTIEFGDGKRQALSKLWLTHPDCRRYDGLVFAPGKTIDPRFYNMWRGFSVEPIKAGEVVPDEWKKGLDQFLEHALVNVCNGDEKLFRYLIGFYAHMIQKPWEKPLVALVFKGKKGVGKNAINERVAALIRGHYTIADDKRYLISNFNGHMESCLMLMLDEAFWSGDKDAEGRLKGLITGTHHNIEHKGKEPFQVDNVTRVIVLGNERWLVPASDDERRYAVFTVGNGRRKDKHFFRTMKERMEDGGYRLLLTYLLNFDISDIDINEAPMTQGLIDQKHASLEPLEQWWLDCLTEGRIVGSAAAGVTFEEINADTFRNAFVEYTRRRGIRVRLPDERAIMETMKSVAPSMTKTPTRIGGARGFVYLSSGLSVLRKDWENFVGMKLSWPFNDEDNGDLECLN